MYGAKFSKQCKEWVSGILLNKTNFGPIKTDNSEINREHKVGGYGAHLQLVSHRKRSLLLILKDKQKQ